MSSDPGHGGLKVVDAYDLPEEIRLLLKPGILVQDTMGRNHRLPRYFYEVVSEEAGRRTRLTQHFVLGEFVAVDYREAERLQEFPRYVPCAIRYLAFYLESFRQAAGATVHIAVNGGYRSPSHKMAVAATPHMWGTAADVYRIGPTILNDSASIAKYTKVAQGISDDFWVMPYGHDPGTSDDHLHLDLGFLSYIPREISEDTVEAPQPKPRFAFEDRRRDERRNDLEETGRTRDQGEYEVPAGVDRNASP